MNAGCRHAQSLVSSPRISVGEDDIAVYTDESRTHVLTNLHHLRQQKTKSAEQAQLCLADFVAPNSSKRADYIGAFAVTAGIGIDAHVARFEAAHGRLQQHHVEGAGGPFGGSARRAHA